MYYDESDIYSTFWLVKDIEKSEQFGLIEKNFIKVSFDLFSSSTSFSYSFYP